MIKENDTPLSPYYSIIEFRQLLNKIENEIQEEIRKNNGDNSIATIGVSIQLMEEEQDDNTPTRGQKADINGYCKSVQADRCSMCDQFDIQAKEFLKSKKNDSKTILFNCHAGVTNFLIPFTPNKEDFEYEGPKFYVFLGHFLLNETVPDYFLYNDDIHVFDKSKDLIPEEYPQFNLLNKFTPNKTPYENPPGFEDSKTIATSSSAEYIDVKERALKLVNDKLISSNIVLIDENKSAIIASPTLINYIERVEPGIIHQNLDQLIFSVGRSIAITKEDKKEYLEILNKLKSRVEVSESKIKQLLSKAGNDKSQLFNYLNTKNGKNTSKKIEEIYTNFSLVSIQSFCQYYANNGFGNSSWRTKILELDRILKNENIEGFKYKQPPKYYAPLKRLVLSIFNIDPKWHEYTGVLLFAVSGNFLYNILNPDSKNLELHYIYCILFGIAGYFLFFFSYRLDLVSKDYFKDSHLKINRSQYVFNRLRNKYKWLLYLPIFMVFILISSRFFNVKEKEDHLVRTHTLTDPHTTNSIGAYNQFGVEQNIFLAQSSFLNDLINNSVEDSSILIVNALCSNGKTIKNLVELNPNKFLDIHGCYESKEAFREAKKNGLFEHQLKECHWGKIDTLFEKNSVDVVFLLNNTLAELTDDSKVQDILSSYYDVIKPGGYLVIDYYDLQKGRKIIAPPKGIGIKRQVEFDPKDSSSYYVTYKKIDVEQNPILDSLLVKRKHSKSISNELNIISTLKELNYFPKKSENIRKESNYPFEFIVAKKK